MTFNTDLKAPEMTRELPFSFHVLIRRSLGTFAIKILLSYNRFTCIYTRFNLFSIISRRNCSFISTIKLFLREKCFYCHRERIGANDDGWRKTASRAKGNHVFEIRIIQLACCASLLAHGQWARCVKGARASFSNSNAFRPVYM